MRVGFTAFTKESQEGRHRVVVASGEKKVQKDELFREKEGHISGEKKNNKHRQFFGIVPGMGGGQFCLCVALFLEKGNT